MTVFSRPVAADQFANVNVTRTLHPTSAAQLSSPPLLSCSAFKIRCDNGRKKSQEPFWDAH